MKLTTAPCDPAALLTGDEPDTVFDLFCRCFPAGLKTLAGTLLAVAAIYAVFAVR